MKSPKLSSLVASTLAFSLTTSAMFVTVSESAAQELAPGIGAPVELAPIPDNDLPPVPEAEIDPDSVLHDRQHHISLDENGGFSGHLVSLNAGGTVAESRMNVSIIRDGAVVASATTHDAGTFSVSGVGQGVVTLLGTSQTGLLLFSIRLVDDGNVFAAATPVKLGSEAAAHGLHTAVVSAADVATVKQLIMGSLPSGDQRFNADVADTDNAFPYGAQTGEKSTSTSHHSVQLQADGSLRGEVNLLDHRTGRHRDIVDLTLHFVHNGQHVGATDVQRDGRFHMAGLAPGQYSIATTGRDGILAMGIEVVGSLAQVEKDDEFKLTSNAQTLELVVSPAQPRDFNTQTAPQFVSEQPIVDSGFGGDLPIGGAPFGGPAGGPLGGTPGGGFGGGSGGGAAGGGGGLGGLLGAAAAGAAGFAIGDDDDRAASPAR